MKDMATAAILQSVNEAILSLQLSMETGADSSFPLSGFRDGLNLLADRFSAEGGSEAADVARTMSALSEAFLQGNAARREEIHLSFLLGYDVLLELQVGEGKSPERGRRILSEWTEAVSALQAVEAVVAAEEAAVEEAVVAAEEAVVEEAVVAAKEAVVEAAPPLPAEAAAEVVVGRRREEEIIHLPAYVMEELRSLRRDVAAIANRLDEILARAETAGGRHETKKGSGTTGVSKRKKRRKK